MKREFIEKEMQNLGYILEGVSKSGNILTFKKGEVKIKVNVDINVYRVFVATDGTERHTLTVCDIENIKLMEKGKVS